MRLRRIVATLLACVACSSEPASDAATPPPEPARGLWLWSSSPAVPADGGELAFVLRNDTAVESPTFGVGNQLERWEAGAWVDAGRVRLCVDGWLCNGGLVDAGDAVEDIGVGAAPGGASSALWLGVEGLELGHHRVVMTGFPDAVVTAQFEVVDKPLDLPPPRRLEGPALTLERPVVDSEGGLLEAYAALPPGGVVTAEDLAAVWPSPPEPVVVEQWDGDGWVEVGSFDVEASDQMARSFDLPALDPGAYRIRAGDVEGRFWVDDLD